jgi:hypothetical protein
MYFLLLALKYSTILSKLFTSIEIETFFRRTAGYILLFFDHKTNEEILEELKVEQFEERPRFKSKWLRHVPRMNSNRTHKNSAEL